MSEGTVVVTGAVQGLGAAISERLRTDGWDVIGVDVAPDQTSRGATRSCDVGDPAQVDSLWRDLDQAGIAADCLVNNAGVFRRERALETRVEDWDRVLAVNLRGAFLMAQHFTRRCVTRGFAGAIVNVSSGQAYRPTSTGVAYAASKAGLSNLTRALAQEWGPLGVRVNAVVPGLTDTAQPRATKNDADFARAAATNPLRRLSEPADIAAAVRFLLSAEAAAITGQALAVNAGRLMI